MRDRGMSVDAVTQGAACKNVLRNRTCCIGGTFKLMHNKRRSGSMSREEVEKIGLSLEEHGCGGVVRMTIDGEPTTVLLYHKVPPRADMVLVQRGFLFVAETRLLGDIMNLLERRGGGDSNWRCQLKSVGRLRAYCRYGGHPRGSKGSGQRKRLSYKIGCQAAVNTKPVILAQQSPEVRQRLIDLCRGDSQSWSESTSLVSVTSIHLTHVGHSMTGEVVPTMPSIPSQARSSSTSENGKDDLPAESPVTPVAPLFGSARGATSSSRGGHGRRHLPVARASSSANVTGENTRGVSTSAPPPSRPTPVQSTYDMSSIHRRSEYPVKHSPQTQSQARELLMGILVRLSEVCSSSDEGMYVGAVMVRMLTQLLVDVNSLKDVSGGVGVAKELESVLHRAVDAAFADSQNQGAPLIVEFGGNQAFLHYSASREPEILEMFEKRNTRELLRAEEWMQTRATPPWLQPVQVQPVHPLSHRQPAPSSSAPVDVVTVRNNPDESTGDRGQKSTGAPSPAASVRSNAPSRAGQKSSKGSGRGRVREAEGHGLEGAPSEKQRRTR